MFNYLIIPLADNAVSFCHYSNSNSSKIFIPIDILREGIFFAQKENLSVQFLYPKEDIPSEYNAVIDEIEHIKIMPILSKSAPKADILVADGIDEMKNISLKKNKVYILRTCRKELNEVVSFLALQKRNLTQLNVVLTDIESFSDKDLKHYKTILKKISSQMLTSGTKMQLNLLTERITLTKMKNCNAGVETITLAPNGFFYPCPAFIDSNDQFKCGHLTEGINIKNPQLYKIEYAPICMHCDAYQCHRCVWLNYKTTHEVNTPSHQQCVISHLEREESRQIIKKIKNAGNWDEKPDIPEIDYLDPFEKHKNWKYEENWKI